MRKLPTRCRKSQRNELKIQVCDTVLQLHEQGFIPGPHETKEEFLQRVLLTEQKMSSCKDPLVGPSHWKWVRLHLRELFDLSPNSLVAFYSNRSLMPWQGALSWIEPGSIVTIQLRKAFQKGTFLRIYSREEILSHEAVHAARAAFPASRFEEFFAYMTSENKWRKVLGPVVQRPWEVWPFACFCVGGWVEERLLWGAIFWMMLGFVRLIRNHRVLRKASAALSQVMGSKKQVRALLLRLTDEEIDALAKGITIENFKDNSLRWELLSSVYQFKERVHGTENHRSA